MAVNETGLVSSLDGNTVKSVISMQGSGRPGRQRIQRGWLLLVADKRMTEGTDSHIEQGWYRVQGQCRVGRSCLCTLMDSSAAIIYFSCLCDPRFISGEVHLVSRLTKELTVPLKNR